MTHYETVLFDLDGVLTDSKEGITKSIQYALSTVGIEVSDLQSLERMIGPPLRETFAEFYQLQDERLHQAILAYQERFADKGVYENRVYEGIEDLLKQLSNTRRKLFMATTKPTIFAQIIADHFQIDQYFTEIVGSNIDGTMVDKTSLIAKILNENKDVYKETTVMIGDRKHDIIGAKNNDIDSIGVCYGYGTLEEIKKAKPTSIAMTVKELGQLLI